jgi:hypothetical protein
VPSQIFSQSLPTPPAARPSSRLGYEVAKKAGNMLKQFDGSSDFEDWFSGIKKYASLIQDIENIRQTVCLHLTPELYAIIAAPLSTATSWLEMEPILRQGLAADSRSQKALEWAKLRQGSSSVKAFNNRARKLLPHLGRNMSTFIAPHEAHEYCSKLASVGLVQKITVYAQENEGALTWSDLFRKSEMYQASYEFAQEFAPASSKRRMTGVNMAQYSEDITDDVDVNVQTTRTDHSARPAKRAAEPEPYQPPQTRSTKRAKGDSDSFCEIHESYNHNTSDCGVNKKDICPFCDQFVGAGKHGAHAAKCKGPRCPHCSRRGHAGEDCFQNKNNKNRTNNAERGPSPRMSRK